MSDISIIKTNAIEGLNKAKQICSAANSNLADSYTSLARKEKLIVELAFIVGSLKNHLKIFDCLKTSILMTITDITQKKDVYIIQAKDETKKLENIFTCMKSIDVDPSLNTDKIKTESHNTLFDYINNVQVDEILSKMENVIEMIESLVDNKIMENIIVRFQNESNYLFNEWESLDSFYQKYFIKKENEKQLDNLVENNSELEAEIIDILKKLNLHLDNCIKYESTDNKDPIVYHEIKRGDIIKQSWIDSLQSNCDIIFQNCRDIEKFISIFEDFRKNLTKCFKEIEEFCNNVLENQIQNNLLIIAQEIKYHFQTLNSYKKEINQFSEDYLQFIDSYYFLILEIERRCKINEKVQHLINNFEKELNILQKEDSVKRLQFMDENGEFLPQNLVDFDMINSKFPTVELKYSLEELPKLKKSVIEESIQKLKGFK